MLTVTCGHGKAENGVRFSDGAPINNEVIMLYGYLKKHFDDEPWAWYTYVIFAVVYWYEEVRYGDISRK